MRAFLIFLAIALTAPLAAAAQSGGALQPHLAVYELSLSGTRAGSNIVAAKGRLVMEITDSCDGYAQAQRMLLRLVDSQGQEILSDSNYTTWESRDGTLIRFNSKNEINGQIQDAFAGRATLEGAGQPGTITFSKPDVEDIDLEAGTIFPIEHYVHLIEAARAGQERLSRRVYDGSGPEGIFDTLAVLSALESEDGEHELLNGLESWRVRLAFYAPGDEAVLPEYEVGFRLYRNGVASEVSLDYGDFRLEAVLSRLEFTDSGC